MRPLRFSHPRWLAQRNKLNLSNLASSPLEEWLTRSLSFLLNRLQEFDHLGIGFVSLRDQVDTSSPMGRVMLTLIGAMAELESSPISERVTAGMKAAKAKGRTVGRPKTPRSIVVRIEKLARTTEMSVRQIHQEIGEVVGRSAAGNIVKEARQVAL